MEETWKAISFSNMYEVSNMGRVRNGNTGKVRKLAVRDGKHVINLRENGKDKLFTVSRAVLEHFVRLPTTGENSSHINGDRLDNRVENLEWSTETNSTCKKNTTTYKGTPICVTDSSGVEFSFESSKEAAEYFGLCRDTIYRNVGKGFINGISVETVKIQPKEGDVLKELQFGDNIVYVTDKGMIKSGNGKWRLPSRTDNGYIRVTLQFDENGRIKRKSNGEPKSESHYMHKLVCLAFHGPPPEGTTDVHHIDENKINNHPDNLQWTSRSTNMSLSYLLGHNTAANKKKVGQYKDGVLLATFGSQTDAGRAMGYTSGDMICQYMKKNKLLNGCEWRFME